MKHLLLSKDLFVYTQEGPPDLKTKDYVKNDQRALTNIVLAIRPSQLYLITSSKSAKEAWDTLKGNFLSLDKVQQQLIQEERKMKECFNSP